MGDIRLQHVYGKLLFRLMVTGPLQEFLVLSRTAHHPLVQHRGV